MRFIQKNPKLALFFFVLFGIIVVAVAKLSSMWFVSNYCTDRNVKTIDRSIGPMRLHAAKACSLADGCGIDVALLDGQIMSNSGEVISKSLDFYFKGNPSVKTVCLNSPGGDTTSAKIIGEKIAFLGLDTCLAEKYVVENEKSITGIICNSACPWVFLAGNKRIQLGEKIKIGIHSAKWTGYFCNTAYSTSKDSNEEKNFVNLISSYSSLNPRRAREDKFHLSLVSASFNVPPSEIKFLSTTELTAAHFYTKN
jgi:hypothetical protein